MNISMFTINRMKDAYIEELKESKQFSDKQIVALAEAFSIAMYQIE